MDITARTEELAQGVVSDQKLELLHVEFLANGSPAVVRVYIDKPGGVNLNDCQKVSRHLALLLEVEDFIDCKYVLEVSSPGLERPLFKADDYRRHIGQEVRLVATDKIDDRRKFKGLIEAFSNGILTLDCQGERYDIPFEGIKKANLVYRF